MELQGGQIGLFLRNGKCDHVLDKKECILKYAKKQNPRNLSMFGFSVIKTEEQFKSAYDMHDLAMDHVMRQYLQNEFNLYSLGADLRECKVIIENELPDYIAERGSSLFCFDAKSKSSTKSFGWVNERAAVSYRKLAKECSVPIYLIFVQIVARRLFGRSGSCSIEDEPISKRKAWDGNVVWIFRWKEGLPYL